MSAHSPRRMGNIAHPAEPRHHLADGPGGPAVGQRRPVDHHDGQAKPARGDQLRLGPCPARVLGDDPADAMVGQKGQIGGLIKRAARDHRLCIRQRQRAVGRIDEAQKVMVLRLRGEGGKRLLADGKENPRGGIGQGRDGGVDAGHAAPVVPRPRSPWRAFEGDQRHAGFGGCVDGIPAHPRREGMGGVDQMGDALGAQIVHQPGDTAEPADPRRQGLRDGRAGAPGIGKDRVRVRPGQRAGKGGGFAGAPEKKDARHG